MTDTSGKDVNMKRFTFIAIVVLVELLSQPGQAADWTAYGLVCDNQVDLWAAKAVSERVKVGGYASWIDNDGATEGAPEAADSGVDAPDWDGPTKDTEFLYWCDECQKGLAGAATRKINGKTLTCCPTCKATEPVLMAWDDHLAATVV